MATLPLIAWLRSFHQTGRAAIFPLSMAVLEEILKSMRIRVTLSVKHSSLVSASLSGSGPWLLRSAVASGDHLSLLSSACIIWGSTGRND